MNETVRSVETDRASLVEKLKDIESFKANKIIESVDMMNPRSFANFKLLEDKFTKVMAENADLQDKNQELEHVIMQLQCETDTIGNK